MNPVLHNLRSIAIRRNIHSPVTSFYSHPPCPQGNYYLRSIHTTSALSEHENINNLKQGHITDPDNLHPQDPYAQSAQEGVKAGKDKTNKSIDAARECEGSGNDKMPKDMGKGNPEKIGFVEQVGGGSGTARKFEREDESRTK